MSFEQYVRTLISEKGKQLDDEIGLPGHIGLTWEILVNFLSTQKAYHSQMRDTLVLIDFKNGDVFHYLLHLASGMVKAMGLDVFVSEPSVATAA